MTQQVIDTPQAQPALGESDHDKAMIALAEGQQPEAQPEGQPEGQPERPEWLDEKFNSPEDLAKAYQELQAKFSRGEHKEQPEAQPEAKPEGETEGQPEEQPEGNLQYNQEKYTKEFMETGSLSEESFSELEKLGIPKETVQFYVDAMKGQQDAAANTIYETVGGQENYQKVIEWAADNVDAGVIAAYNTSIDNNDAASAKQILDTINKQYQGAIGYEGKMVNGARTQSGSDVYTDWSQVTKDMDDPRYRGVYRDESYVRSVEQKLMRSNI